MQISKQWQKGSLVSEKIVNKHNVWANVIKILVTIQRRDRKGERTATVFELELKAADNSLVSAFQRIVGLCNSLHLLQKKKKLIWWRVHISLSIKVSIYNIVRTYTGGNSETKKQWKAQPQLITLQHNPYT